MTLRSYRSKGQVRDTYRLNHKNQTLDFVLNKKKQFNCSKPILGEINIWDIIEKLDNTVDESDPDTSAPQSQHALQTAEGVERVHPELEWLQVTGLIHDLGKILLLFGEPQWAVVGDTFPVGCKFSSDIVYPELFRENTDYGKYDELGIYQEGCGLDKVHFSWGHDEFLASVLEENIRQGRCKLPKEAVYIVRYHSFYAHHQSNAYNHLLDDLDRKMLSMLKEFQKFDLYTKVDDTVDISNLKEKWKGKLRQFFPEPLVI